MEINRDTLLELAKKRVYLEGNILKVIKADKGDTELSKYYAECERRDTVNRKKRLEVTKQVQQQNKELQNAAVVKESLVLELQSTLEQVKESKQEAEKLRDEALEDLDVMQKRKQFELITNIVKVALGIIMAVLVTTTILYMIVLFNDLDSTIIETTWSNLFGILLTNSFSIIGTIMGVKYATRDS